MDPHEFVCRRLAVALGHTDAVIIGQAVKQIPAQECIYAAIATIERESKLAVALFVDLGFDPEAWVEIGLGLFDLLSGRLQQGLTGTDIGVIFLHLVLDEKLSLPVFAPPELQGARRAASTR